jgi:BirA family biotin operon repressor/biotin-[acetyl-CoA-carboxylase] ligase
MSHLILLERVGSTQDEVHRLAEEGAPDGTAVVAGQQTAGRGSRGRQWQSPVGGLWLSVLRRPTAESAAPLVLSLSAGLAVAEALEAAGVPKVMLKWPNDLMIGTAKIGGILCEIRWHGERAAWAAIGVGINVANDPPETVPDAGAVNHYLGQRQLAVSDLARPVAAALRRVALDRELSPADLARFARRDWLRGRRIRDPIPGGVGSGIDPFGALLVTDTSGAIVSVSSGSVAVDPSDPRPTPRAARLTPGPETS